MDQSQLKEILDKHDKWRRGEADGARANLADADLARANLAGANLAGADLAGANLADANLADADLARANLVDADLAGANLADAYLVDAYLAGARNAPADRVRAVKHSIIAILSTFVVACGGIVDAPSAESAPPTDAPDAGTARTLCACTVGTWSGRQWCAPDGAPLGPCIADSMPPAERFARAVCTCQGNPPGCLANVIGESWRAPAACLDAMAAGYEVNCTGRSGPNGCN